MKKLDDELILRIEGLTQQIEDKRELIRSFFPDASAYSTDGTSMQSLCISEEDRMLTNEAVMWMREFIHEGVIRNKATKKESPKREKKTINIQEIINGKTEDE